MTEMKPVRSETVRREQKEVQRGAGHYPAEVRPFERGQRALGHRENGEIPVPKRNDPAAP